MKNRTSRFIYDCCKQVRRPQKWPTLQLNRHPKSDMVARSILLPLAARACSTLLRSNPISSNCITAAESPGCAPKGSAGLGEGDTTKQSSSAEALPAAAPPPAVAYLCVHERAVRLNSDLFSMYLRQFEKAKTIARGSENQP